MVRVFLLSLCGGDEVEVIVPPRIFGVEELGTRRCSLWCAERTICMYMLLVSPSRSREVRKMKTAVIFGRKTLCRVASSSSTVLRLSVSLEAVEWGCVEGPRAEVPVSV